MVLFSCCQQKRSVPAIVLTRLFGILFFLFMLAALNILIPVIPNRIFEQIVEFLTVHVWLVVLFSILFLIGEVLYELIFPLDLLAPLFSGLGSVFLLSFIFKFLYYTDTITRITNFTVLESISPLIYLIIFLIVLITGYIDIIGRFLGRRPTPPEGAVPGTEIPRPEGGPSEERTLTDPSWDDIGGELRRLIYDSIHEMREGLKRDK